MAGLFESLSSSLSGFGGDQQPAETPAADDSEDITVVARKNPAKQSTVLETLGEALIQESGSVRSYADVALTQAVKTTDEINQLKREAVGVAETYRSFSRDVSEDVISNATTARNKLNEARQTRDAIANRETEVKAANPLIRALRSVVDPTWNLDRIRKEKGIAQNRIAEAVSDASATQSINQTILSGAEAGYRGDMGVINAVTEASAFKLSGLAEQTRLAATVADATGKAIGAHVTATQSALMMAEFELSKLPMDEVVSLRAQAKRAGYVLVNGNRIDEGMIEERYKNLTQREMSLESQRNGIISQKMGIERASLDLDEARQDKIIDTMSASELSAAISAGGVFAGQQIPVHKLGAALGAQMESFNRGSIYQLASTGAGATLKATSGTLGQLSAISTNLNEVFGESLPPELRAAVANIQRVGESTKSVVETIKANPRLPNTGSLSNELFDTAQQTLLATTKAVDSYIKVSGMAKASGDALRARLVGGGIPEPRIAAGAIRDYATTGIPPYAATPEANISVRAANLAIQNVMTTQAYATANSAGKQEMVDRAVAGAAGGAFNTELQSSFLGLTPRIFREVGIKLPVADTELMELIQQGSASGRHNTAANYGITAADLGKPWSVIQAKVVASPGAKADGIVDEAGFREAMQAGEVMAIVATMSKYKPGLGTRFAMGINNPQVQAIGQNQVGAALAKNPDLAGLTGKSGLGIPNALGRNFAQAAEVYGSSQAAIVTRAPELYKHSPKMFGSLVIRSTEGLDPAVRKRAQEYYDKNSKIDKNGLGTYFATDDVVTVFSGAKFPDDPEMTRAAKIIVNEHTSTVRRVGGFLDAIANRDDGE